MHVSKQSIVVLINEKLSADDKSELKKMIGTELDKRLKRELKSVLADELAAALKSKDTKADIGEIAKKVIKKLYKDLSFHHPYIIDRIKV
tara:strand:+ start:2962 stop:3231 length:270 start_codon:yes stop_codon:yes gene_type:complete